MKKLFLSLLSGAMLLHGNLFAQSYSLDFDGTNDKVVLANNAVFNLTNAITIEAWINATQWKPQQWAGTIVSKDGDNAGKANGYVLRCGNNGTLSFTVGTGTAGAWPEVYSTPMMVTGKWYHVAGVFDGAQMKIYINGVLQASINQTTPIANNSAFNVQLGECSGFAGRVFNGKIDEVRIWSVALTQEEIYNNMGATLSGTEAGLVAYYKMNDGPGSTVLTDAGPTHLNGTLTNMDPATDWTSNYEPPYDNIGITSIISPCSAPVWDNLARVKVEVRNYAFNDVSNFPITYICNGDTVTETFEGTLHSGERVNFTFNSFIDLTTDTIVMVEAYTSLPGDSDTMDDYKSATLYETNLLNIFYRIPHNFGAAGQTRYATFNFPEKLDNVSQILMHVSLNCPSTGCDPWDQPAKVSLIKNGHKYEIARYITPYGKACGPWTVDISDFKSLLTGTCQFESYVQVWGTSGWLVTIKIEFITGSPEYQYSKIDPIYEKDYQVYGDPGISYDLPEMVFPIAPTTEKAVIRMTNSGHGQQNTDNAAEFSDKTHYFWINGVQSFEHHLWKDDCEQNTCANQYGQYPGDSRAGWCPGQQVIPVWYDLGPVLTPGSDMALDYVLQPYTNLLNTGYDGDQHTEPYYRIHSFLVQSSNTPYEDIKTVGVLNFVSPLSGSLSDPGNHPITVTLKNFGTVPVANIEVGYYINGSVPVYETLTDTIFAGESMEHSFSGTENFTAGNLYKIVAFTTLEGDMNSGDDAAQVVVTPLSSIADYDVYTHNLNIKIMPNPARDFVKVKILNSNSPAQVEVSDLRGQTFLDAEFNGEIMLRVSSLPKGIYVFKIKTRYAVEVEKIKIE